MEEQAIDDRRGATVGLYNGERVEMEVWWRLVRVLLGGTDTLRKAGEDFSPPTAREMKEKGLYQVRMNDSVLVPWFESACEDIASRAFEKPPTITGDLGSSMMARIEGDADRMGTSLSRFFAQHFKDAVNYGMGLFLVDNVDARDQTGAFLKQPQAEAMDARPYLVRIIPDNLIGFTAEKIGGRDVCTELRVREWTYKRKANSFQDELVERVRVYTTETVSLWERSYGSTAITSDRSTTGRGDLTGYVLVEGPKPTLFPNGEIPLVVTYTGQQGFLFAKPPLLQLAHLNLNHWNKTSRHDNGIKYCLHPTLFGKGLSKKETEQKPRAVEGNTLMTESKDAELMFIEITGTTFDASMQRIMQLEKAMQSLASDPFTEGSATATGEMRAEMKGQSQAQSWVEACEWSIYRAYELAAAWLQEELPEDFNVSLYRQSSVMMVANPARAQALFADWKEGAITLETYLKERARSGQFGDDFDPEAEAEAIRGEQAASDEARMMAMANQIEAERMKQGQPQDPPQDPNKDAPQPPDAKKVPA